jgi:hypothetical protein
MPVRRLRPRGLLAKLDFNTGPLPYWAFMRMMFPVDESLGDLNYRRNGATAQNLTSVLESEFEAIRTGYAGKAAVLTLLYRHSRYGRMTTVVFASPARIRNASYKIQRSCKTNSGLAGGEADDRETMRVNGMSTGRQELWTI